MTNNILTLAALLISFESFSQTQTLENGVVVHSSLGMEGLVVAQPASTINRSIAVWNLSECLDALSAIDLKCQDLSPEDCQLKYATVRLEITNRITELQTITE